AGSPRAGAGGSRGHTRRLALADVPARAAAAAAAGDPDGLRPVIRARPGRVRLGGLRGRGPAGGGGGWAAADLRAARRVRLCRGDRPRRRAAGDIVCPAGGHQPAGALEQEVCDLMRYLLALAAPTSLGEILPSSAGA